jgi:plastocyanin
MKLALTTLVALALAGTALAAGQKSATLTIRHQLKGCHSWSFDGKTWAATQKLTVARGSTLAVVDNDVMPHKLIQAAGPKMRLTHSNMLKMGSSATVRLTQKGVYRFTTKAGEDYSWARSMKTSGEDHVLLLTVRVK